MKKWGSNISRRVRNRACRRITCWKKWQPFQCFVAFWSGKKCSQKRSFFFDFATLTAQISDLFCLATFIDHCACRPLRFFSWGQDTKRFPNAIARIECIDRSWHWNHHPFTSPPHPMISVAAEACSTSTERSHMWWGGDVNGPLKLNTPLLLRWFSTPTTWLSVACVACSTANER